MVEMGNWAVFVILAIAALHLCILYVEMFAWESIGRKVFKSLPAELFAPTKAMAANQGLYNGFLAAGLLWSMIIHWTGDPEWARNVALFFLACVFVAGVYGAWTVSRVILLVQSLPAVIGIVLVFLK